jgi:hypothetical protein
MTTAAINTSIKTPSFTFASSTCGDYT